MASTLTFNRKMRSVAAELSDSTLLQAIRETAGPQRDQERTIAFNVLRQEYFSRNGEAAALGLMAQIRAKYAK